MTNPYLITYIFGQTTSIGLNLGNGDLCLITLQFTVDDAGDNVTCLASNQNLIMKKRGTIGMNYDFDNNFLMPNEYAFEVADLDGELRDLLYDGALAGKVRKEFFVKVEIKYSGTFTYVTEFSGYNANDLLDFDVLNKTHFFTALPRTNILNETYLFSKEWRSDWFDADPLRSDTWPNNPLDLDFYKIDTSARWNWVYLKERTGEKGLINEIFKLINPSITVDFVQNWTFYGNDWPGYAAPNNEKLDITFADLILDGNWVGGVFSSNMLSQVESVGDLLKLLAFEFGCMAGVTTQDKAFFKQMFYFDANNVQTLGTLTDQGYRKKYKFNKVDYVELNSVFLKQDTNQANRYVPQNYKPAGFAPFFNQGKISGNNGLSKELITCADSFFYFLGYGQESSTASNLRAANSGDPNRFYQIYGVKDNFIALTPLFPTFYLGGTAGFMPLALFLAEYYYNLKGLLYKMQVHEFTVDGLNYDFLKGFVHEGSNFSIIGLEKDLDKCLTKIEALKIEEHTASGGEGGEGTPITVPLELVSRSIAPYSAPFDYGKATGLGIKLMDVEPGDWTNEFIVDLDEAFLPNQIAGFRIYDGSETLMSSDDFDIYSRVTYIHRKVKKYSTADTIYFELTPGAETPNTGYGTLMAVLLKKV